jgi:hypothetical protein
LLVYSRNNMSYADDIYNELPDTSRSSAM